MRTSVSFQIESIVETFDAERAQVTLLVAVTLEVAIQQPLQTESLGADGAGELGRLRVAARLRLRNFYGIVFLNERHSLLADERILESVTAVYEFEILRVQIML